jgi:hypothetical protein
LLVARDVASAHLVDAGRRHAGGRRDLRLVVERQVDQQ